MKSARPRLRIALLVTPLVAALLYIALNWYALVEEDMRVGMKREAIENPYLAYSRVLERMGVHARFVREPHGLDVPRGAGTLVLGPHRLIYMTPQRLREIVEWTRGGGHLVVAAETPVVNDPLLDALGIERRELQSSARAPANPRAMARAAQEATNAVSFDWPDAPRPLRVRLLAWFDLRDSRSRPDVLSVKRGNKTALLRFAEGAGMVTVVTSLDFVTNGFIGSDDDALFGWRLATDAGPGAPATLFLGVHAEPLLQWIGRVALPVVISAALLLALWLARIIPRFGPLAPEPAPVRRSLLEHVIAAGRFLWSRDERQFLLDAARERAWQSARRRGVARDPASLARSLGLLATAAGTTEADVRTALVDPASDAAGFVRAIAALHRIESRLAHGASFHRAHERTTP